MVVAVCGSGVLFVAVAVCGSGGCLFPAVAVCWRRWLFVGDGGCLLATVAVCWRPVLRIRIRDPGLGTFLTSGSGMGESQHLDPG